MATQKWLITVAWEHSRHFATPLVSPRNDVWETSAEIPYWWRVTTPIWVVLLIGWGTFSTNLKHYPDLVNDASSVWNFCGRFSEVISQGNQWWRQEMSAVFSGYDNILLMASQEKAKTILMQNLGGKQGVLYEIWTWWLWPYNPKNNLNVAVCCLLLLLFSFC